MKIVQSFWSGNPKNISNNYGWFEPKYNWISWILSCQQLLKYYDKVELYTDDFGYEILINKLQLPYTKVHIVLNELDIYSKDLWAIAKIKVYSLQNEPFIHIDGDVFIWDKFPESLINSNLIAQNPEKPTDYYRKMWGEIFPELEFVPDEMSLFHNENTNFCANMGIVGGNDFAFFKEYAEKSFEFVLKNNIVWNNINLFNFNIFFEQVLFYEMAILKGKKINYLFKEVLDDNLYAGFGDFHKIPYNRTYLHLLGNFKRNQNVCKAMEAYTMRYYPTYYSYLAKLLNNQKNDNFEIDFLTPNVVNEIIFEFDNEIQENKIIKDNFLLKRNLNNVDLFNKLNFFLKQKINFWITKLGGFEIVITKKGEMDFTFLEVQEINSLPRVYEIDEVDAILISELDNPNEYFNLIKKMESYLEENNQESKEELLEVVNNKIENYINLKIISIHS
ncbi:MAG: DUF6734 family protein [Flavobacterium sp.]